MANIAGFEVPTPNIDITGIFSSSWIYVFIVAILGFFIILGVAILLFFKTWNRKVNIFENISGLGYVPVIKTRARIIKLGLSGEEILKTLAGGRYLTAYGRKMGKNNYWFAKGQDGYLYNFVLGDLDTKLRMLDVEPIDRDVRMFHIAIDKLNQLNYGNKSNFEKYAPWIVLFVIIVILIVVMWIWTGEIKGSTEQLATASQALADALKAQHSGVTTTSSGLVPA